MAAGMGEVQYVSKQKKLHLYQLQHCSADFSLASESFHEVKHNMDTRKYNEKIRALSNQDTISTILQK